MDPKSLSVRVCICVCVYYSVLFIQKVVFVLNGNLSDTETP